MIAISKNIYGLFLLNCLLVANVGADPVVKSGQLIGATNISVGGGLYDVSFGDGACIDRNFGCDADLDFIFHASDNATLASQALIDQVFIDGPLGNFSSDNSLTRGCEWQFGCTVLTAYSLRPTRLGLYVNAAVAQNSTSSPGNTAFTSVAISDDLISNSTWTYAVWRRAEQRSIPALSPWGLGLLTFLLGVAVFRSRRQLQ